MTAVTVPLSFRRFVAENGVRGPGAVKIVADAGTRAVLGIHVLGSYARDDLAALALELSTIDDLRQIVFPHPTISEGIREAAWALG